MRIRPNDIFPAGAPDIQLRYAYLVVVHESTTGNVVEAALAPIRLHQRR